ncbi:MAG TPA: urate hydroxylase PuuD [Planctomycetota bacterium]|nr:urate hydroxylase PuuD [Planctomycetota bacterium]
MPDLVTSIIPIALRWVHVLAGIIWIGHLYFFNFVNVNFEKAIDASLKKTIIPQLRPRALWWFRVGAMITMVTGVTYILWEQFVAGHAGFSNWWESGNNLWITMGMLFGLVMWFNVWFVIWPNQKIILAGISTGNKPADFDARVATAGKFSRINTYLSVPMLFGMLGRQSFTIPDVLVRTEADGMRVTRPDWGPILVIMAVVIALGFATAHHFIYMLGPRVGKEFISAAPAAPPPAPPPPK